MRLVKFIRF